MFENERSAYPHPDEFKVMRPEYIDPEEDEVDVIAIINIAPFRVTGNSATRAGARRAAIYEAAKTYHNYHPSYRVESPFPNEFVDPSGVTWKRNAEHLRDKYGDYEFADPDGEDYADIDQMLLWDVRPAPAHDDDDE